MWESEGMSLVPALIGLLLLLMGRRVFWFFVGAVGFSAGFDAAGYLFAGQSEGFLLIAGIVSGLIGILLALLFQRLAIILAGMIGGGVFATHLLLVPASYPGEGAVAFVFILGAVIGGVLINVAFGAGLIVISSLVGALLIAGSLPAPQETQNTVLLIAVAVGLLYQFTQSGPGKRSRSKTE